MFVAFHRVLQFHLCGVYRPEGVEDGVEQPGVFVDGGGRAGGHSRAVFQQLRVQHGVGMHRLGGQLLQLAHPIQTPRRVKPLQRVHGRRGRAGQLAKGHGV